MLLKNPAVAFTSKRSLVEYLKVFRDHPACDRINKILQTYEVGHD